METTVQNKEISQFRVRVIGEPSETSQTGPKVLLDSMSRSVRTWEETEYEPDEEEDKSEDLVVATGCLDLQMEITPAIFAELNAHDSDEFESLVVSIVYLDSEGAPVYKHIFECDPSLDLIQESGANESVAYLNVYLDYYSVSKFVPAEAEDVVVLQ